MPTPKRRRGEALTLNPEHKAARYSLGRALAAQGSTSPEAERLLRESLKDFPEARLSLAQVLMNRCANLDAAAELRTYLDFERGRCRERGEECKCGSIAARRGRS